jgi:sialic acid synthase SpsE
MNGSLETAKRMVLEAQRCGADAVKVQTLDPFGMPDKDETVKGGVPSKWIGRRWLDVYKATFLPWQDQLNLKRFAEDRGVIFFASVYSPKAVDFWERNGGLPAYKIAAWQARNTELIQSTCDRGRPVVISVDDIWPTPHLYWPQLFQPPYTGDVLYLAKDSLWNLKYLGNVGYSNHKKLQYAIRAAKLGAVIVEQHFRIDEGLDLCAALPDEFKAMVEAIRKVERCES